MEKKINPGYIYRKQFLPTLKISCTKMNDESN